MLPIVLLGYLGARDNTGRLLRDRGEAVLDVLVDRVAAHLDPVRVQVAYVTEAVRQGRLDPRDDAAMRTFVVAALAATPQTLGVGLIRPDLRITRYNRADFRVFDNTDPAAFPAARSSLEEARAGTGPRWAGPVWSTLLDQPILQLRAPLVGADGAFEGVLVAAVTIKELSRYLGEIAEDLGQTPFILVGRDRVLAHPALAPGGQSYTTGIGEATRPVTTFEDPVLARIWTRAAEPLSSHAPLRRSQGHWSWLNDQGYEAHAYLYRTIAAYGEAPWTVGLHYPALETRRERWVVIGIGLGGTALLGLACLAAIVAARRLARPVLGLAETARRIEALDFDSVRCLPRGPVREINLAASAIERMAEGLSWFQTYVPRTLVRRLMAAGHVPGAAEQREVTVMFTDLERYTDFSAQRPATEVVDYLNGLLVRIGPILEASGGTIDKFIGDSVMAFWGAPEDHPDHAAAACRAACRIAAEVEAWNNARRLDGLHACRMRIGLHTGPVAVGNVGFTGRVDYTIVGRTVNVAQRLEQAARQLFEEAEVAILVSDETARRAGQGFAFEPREDIRIAFVDAVAVLRPEGSREATLSG
ncbi:adenylate/guanylate cyclase domain-containing protein [Methylobacterium oryzisoli]|uniref:adenylate/guanylate cyclase domain-containing protein n=1 Tax=Methylobacterium oryzisoli TaxID=3385502 RepID=UPI0038918FDE